MNYHTLADFRAGNADVLDDLLSQSVAALLASGEVTLTRVAHDGIRIRAAAGAGSFHRRSTIERHLAEAEAKVAALKAELDEDPAATSRRIAAARARAARERASRARAALGTLPAIEAAKRRRRPADPAPTTRASTTDPEARIMRLGDGAYRPAHNGQITTDVGSGLVCAVGVTTSGTDQGQLRPAVGRLERAFGRTPAELLADGGFSQIVESRFIVSPRLRSEIATPQ